MRSRRGVFPPPRPSARTARRKRTTPGTLTLMATRHIVYMPLGALTPAPDNPKLHDLPALMASLERYGWTDPMLVCERLGLIAAGHGRREAAIALKEQGAPPPGGVHVDDDGDWLVPVLRGWASRSDAEFKAYLIADNQLTIAGGWHMRSLAQLLEEVVTEDAPLMETLGWTADDLDDLLRRVDPETIGNHDDGDGWGDDGSAPLPDPTAGDDTDDDGGPGETPRGRCQTCPACGFEFEAA